MYHYFLFVMIMGLELSFCWGCADEVAQTPVQESNPISNQEIRNSIPRQNSALPVSFTPSRIYGSDSESNWVGNSAYYATIFEERMESASAEVRRLYVRATSSPYHGIVTRLYLSGAPEYQADFDDGFRKGVAYWWSPDGQLVRASNGLEGNFEELDLSFVVNPIEKVVAEVNAREEEPHQPVFHGSVKRFEEWNEYDSENRLTDGTTGEPVSGQVKLYGDDGKLQSKTNYRDGLVHGFSNSYHSNGVQATKTVFSNGDKVGTDTWWRDNGLKSYEANFVNGKMNGLETLWSEDGSISSQLRYNDGKLVETVYTKE